MYNSNKIRMKMGTSWGAMMNKFLFSKDLVFVELNVTYLKILKCLNGKKMDLMKKVRSFSSKVYIIGKRFSFRSLAL